MRKEMIGTASGLALLLATVAVAVIPDGSFAQQNPVTGTKSPAAETKKGERTPGMGTRDGPSTLDKSSDYSAQDVSASYKSYKMHSGAVKGQIAGRFSADRLIGGDVVNVKNESIGEVADLLIDQNGLVRLAVVEVGGFLGIGSRAVAVDIIRLTPHGNEEKTFRTMMTKKQLESQPEFELRDGIWRQKNESGMNKPK